VHPPGHAQADFGEAIGVIGGVERKIHFFAMDLPHSDAIFVVGWRAIDAALDKASGLEKSTTQEDAFDTWKRGRDEKEASGHR
jgi:hypothetical protein